MKLLPTRVLSTAFTSIGVYVPLVAAALLISGTSRAVTLHDEAVDGELPWFGFWTPSTDFVLSAGNNIVSGTIEEAQLDPVNDGQDFWRLAMPPHHRMGRVTLVSTDAPPGAPVQGKIPGLK